MTGYLQCCYKKTCDHGDHNNDINDGDDDDRKCQDNVYTKWEYWSTT